MACICFIGSSKLWTPGLATDLMMVFDEPLEIRMLDLDPKAAEACVEWGEKAVRFHGRKDRFIPFTDRRAALKGVDAVLITLATGGDSGMACDLQIPEQYGIYATVADTAGPGGWSRNLRNIPVFRRIAADLQELCPTAFVANYSNPLSALTATLQRCCQNPSVGLCHAYFTTKDVIQKIFDLPDWGKISIAIAGMNHFTWVVDFKIGRENGYKLLREKLAGRSLHDILSQESADEIGMYSGHELCAQLYAAYGYLPYPSDRHTGEFVSFTLSGNPERYRFFSQRDNTYYDTMRYCNIKRTTMEHRLKRRTRHEQTLADLVSGKAPMPKKSRETGAEMIRAYLHNKPFVDAVNCLNCGQIDGLPEGACVETLGIVDGLGVRPLMVENVPEPLLEMMRPQAVAQKWTVEGVLQDDNELLFQALLRDPQCAHLKPHEVRQMGQELITANQALTSPPE